MTRRSEDFTFTGGVVIVPVKVAALLGTLIPSDLLMALRLRDPESYALLAQLRIIALDKGKLGSGTSRGTSVAPTSEPRSDLSATAAARRIGISARGIRKACTDGRLPATQVDGRWYIATADADTFRAERVD